MARHHPRWTETGLTVGLASLSSTKGSLSGIKSTAQMTSVLEPILLVETMSASSP